MPAMKKLSEDDTSAKLITPALHQAGWAEAAIRRQVAFTAGRIIVRGKLVTRGKAKRADYVLYIGHFPIALIEAKHNFKAVGDGMQQALDYATTLDIPFVFSSNGHGFVLHDRTGIGATVQHLRVGGIETLLIPLPPLAEQHRIVAKVDELMALCDQLEAQLTTTQTDSRRLLEAVLEAALAPV